MSAAEPSTDAARATDSVPSAEAVPPGELSSAIGAAGRTGIIRPELATESTTSFQTVAEPSLFVAFGGTGDLARRKLLPALWRLYRGGLARDTVVLAISRDAAMDDAGFRKIAVDAVRAADPTADAAAVGAWTERMLHYQPLDDDFGGLRRRIEALEGEF